MLAHPNDEWNDAVSAACFGHQDGDGELVSSDSGFWLARRSSTQHYAIGSDASSGEGASVEDTGAYGGSWHTSDGGASCQDVDSSHDSDSSRSLIAGLDGRW